MSDTYSLMISRFQPADYYSGHRTLIPRFKVDEWMNGDITQCERELDKLRETVLTNKEMTPLVAMIVPNTKERFSCFDGLVLHEKTTVYADQILH